MPPSWLRFCSYWYPAKYFQNCLQSFQFLDKNLETITIPTKGQELKLAFKPLNSVTIFQPWCIVFLSDDLYSSKTWWFLSHIFFFSNIWTFAHTIPLCLGNSHCYCHLLKFYSFHKFKLNTDFSTDGLSFFFFAFSRAAATANGGSQASA